MQQGVNMLKSFYLDRLFLFILFSAAKKYGKKPPRTPTQSFSWRTGCPAWLRKLSVRSVRGRLPLI